MQSAARWSVLFVLLTVTGSKAQDNLILNLEAYLAELGFNSGVVDGVADQSTYAAVSAYQSSRGLPVTGGMNLAEYQALEVDALSQQRGSQTPLRNVLSVCQGKRAFGKISNIASSSSDRLGDFCVDHDKGSIAGPISLSGLTLTKHDGVNFTFEDLAGRSGNQMQIAPVLTATYHSGKVEDQSPEINVLAGSEFFVGFIYNELASPKQLADKFHVFLADGASIDGMTPLGFVGDAVFQDGSATVALSDNTQYGTAKETEGYITLTVADDGSVTGSGALKTRNIRLAGYKPNEWVSMSITIDQLRGFATGPTGQVIKSYALVTANIIDVEGDSSQSKGSLEVFLFDPQIWE